jgi:hypothetical protein
MEGWWIVLGILVLAVIGIFYVLLHRSGRGPRPPDAEPTANRDFVQERETARLGDMSEEDRAWQAASLEKDRTRRDGPQPPP